MSEVPVEVVDSFCYLGDVIRWEGGAETAVRGRIACAWKEGEEEEKWDEEVVVMMERKKKSGRGGGKRGKG